MQLYVIRRPSAWADLAELEQAGAKSARIGNEEMPDKVRWIRSYVVREPDGLALSSRNAYLNMTERRAALCLWRCLGKAAALVRQGETAAAVILDAVRREIANEPLAQLEYASLNDAEDLMEIAEVRDVALLALAVWIGKTRLIVNIILKKP